MSRSALTSIATAVRLAAASGVTAAQLAAATGLSHAQAGKILRGLEREGVLSGDSPTRSGAPRGSWGRTWKLELPGFREPPPCPFFFPNGKEHIDKRE